uniref:Putative lipoyltransferase 2, mitochondrial n=1 Tax=Rhabditophanes sp. KR3021 TaxID=114890 RepID=A0AC35UCS8_9BILA
MTARLLKPIWLGRMRYKEGLAVQEMYVEKVKKDRDENYLLLVEHEPVYTIGVRNGGYTESMKKRLEAMGAEFHQVKRGGLVTFHGPGQLVGYPIVDVKSLKIVGTNGLLTQMVGPKKYVNLLEESLIQLCRQDFNLTSADRSLTHPGVWLNGEKAKICAIGVAFSHSVTYHGFALNVNTDMRWFDAIVPCGIEGKEVTSVGTENNMCSSVRDTISPYIKRFSQAFQMTNIAPLQVQT